MWPRIKRITRLEVVILFVVVATLLGIAGPAVLGQITRQRENAQAGEATNIALAMFNYNTDNGAYPSGPTSTAILQKLYDGHYLGDGKPVKLKPAEVYWDVLEHDDGSGLTGEDPGNIPLIISTGLGPQRFQGAAGFPITGIPIITAITVARLDQSTVFLRPTAQTVSPSPILDTKGRWYKTVTP